MEYETPLCMKSCLFFKKYPQYVGDKASCSKYKKIPDKIFFQAGKCKYYTSRIKEKK